MSLLVYIGMLCGFMLKIFLWLHLPQHLDLSSMAHTHTHRKDALFSRRSSCKTRPESWGIQQGDTSYGVRNNKTKTKSFNHSNRMRQQWQHSDLPTMNVGGRRPYCFTLFWCSYCYLDIPLDMLQTLLLNSVFMSCCSFFLSFNETQ